ncbi:uncharacterized protein LOC108029035 [Drosophila biarmipes]|uniref:uncharacterized protein LOC108029035 n=1 Tax=Drosophila biarmipes TaxID=125945 RepID=UPI0007E6D226|nr:uncharacterized protein LOC108029035 [Drosophila biarmipes]
MSRTFNRDEIPRDRGLVQELRSEITRNSAEISFNFWQEFEHIRSTQQNRMVQERLQRERISTLMRDGQQEANQEAEALSRSISAHGMTVDSTHLPSISAPAAPTASRLENSLAQEFKNRTHRPSTAVRRKPQKQKFQATKTNKSKARPKNEDQPSPAPSNIPRAPPTSRATMITPNISNGATPNISKLRLANKPKK